MHLRFISDPGHGWLEVPMQMVEQLEIKEQITAYSYRKGDLAYLEEDCDAYVFLQTCRDQGFEYQLEEVFEDPTPIRRYARFTA